MFESSIAFLGSSNLQNVVIKVADAQFLLSDLKDVAFKKTLFLSVSDLVYCILLFGSLGSVLEIDVVNLENEIWPLCCLLSHLAMHDNTFFQIFVRFFYFRHLDF